MFSSIGQEPTTSPSGQEYKSTYCPLRCVTSPRATGTDAYYYNGSHTHQLARDCMIEPLPHEKTRLTNTWYATTAPSARRHSSSSRTNTTQLAGKRACVVASLIPKPRTYTSQSTSRRYVPVPFIVRRRSAGRASGAKASEPASDNGDLEPASALVTRSRRRFLAALASR